MPGCINQIKLVGLISMRILHAHRAGFDRDTAFSFEFHVVEQLFLHFPFGNRTSVFQQAIRQRAFAVVNVGNNAEITDVLEIHIVVERL